MKIVEMRSNVAVHIVPFWSSMDEIPADVPDIYREVSDEVQEGWVYDPETGEFSEPGPVFPCIPPVTNEELMQATMHVTAMMDLLIDQGELSVRQRPDGNADTHLSRYDFWRQSYFRKHTTEYTLQRLVDGWVLTQDEVEGIVADRVAEFGV